MHVSPESAGDRRAHFSILFNMRGLGVNGTGFPKMARKLAGPAGRGRVRQIDERRAKRPERRRSERLPLGIPVFVRGFDERKQPFVEFATAWNVSSHGALVATKRYLALTKPISLDLPVGPLPPKTTGPPHVQSLSATPVCVTQSEQFYLTGLEFSKPLKKQRRTASEGNEPPIF